MASLAERESLRGKVQCIYFDPPYGIKFNSNWQVSTQSRDVKDGKQTDITREPEQVKAFRDTWKDGIHSYLTYLRDRLTVARDLLTESGSIFVQIGDENVHRVRAVMDEVFGAENFVCADRISKDSRSIGDRLARYAYDYIIWYREESRQREISDRSFEDKIGRRRRCDIYRVELSRWRSTATLTRRSRRRCEAAGRRDLFASDNLTSQTGAACDRQPISSSRAELIARASGHWKTTADGHETPGASRSAIDDRQDSFDYVRYLDDFPVSSDQQSFGLTLRQAVSATTKIYVVQTAHDGDRTLHPDDHRPRRPRARSRPAAPAPPPTSPSNGAGAGSPSTPAASRWRLPARG